MAVNLADPIPDWTDGTDHWRDADVTWLVDRIVLRLPDRTTVTAGSGNAGKVIYSIADAAPYISVGSVWKSILASTKMVLTEGTDPELRLSAQGAGSGIVFKSASTIAINTLQVSGGTTISGALQAASVTSTGSVTAGAGIFVTGNSVIQGTLTSGAISAPSITGNAATATKLATARTISLSQDVSGSASFDGSGNAFIITTVNNKTSSSASNTLVLRDVNHAFAAGGTCQFLHLNIAGNTTMAGQLNASNIAINGSITGSSSINCFQITVAGSVLGNFANFTNIVRSGKGGVTALWDTSHFVADAADNGAAALALKSGGIAVILRMDAGAQSLFITNSNGSDGSNLYAKSFQFYSSARYKTDIKPLDIDALDVVRQLAPVSWRSKADETDEQRHIGFIAEEVDEVFPQAVSFHNGRPEGLNAASLDTLSLMASAQLLSRIEAIEARLA